MIKIITHVLVVAIALIISAQLIPGIEITGFYIAVVSAVVIGLINLIIRPILFVLTLPLTILTFGLFAFVLNALMVWFAASFIEGFSIDGFWPALLCSLVVSVASFLASRLSSD